MVSFLQVGLSSSVGNFAHQSFEPLPWEFSRSFDWSFLQRFRVSVLPDEPESHVVSASWRSLLLFKTDDVIVHPFEESPVVSISIRKTFPHTDRDTVGDDQNNFQVNTDFGEDVPGRFWVGAWVDVPRVFSKRIGRTLSDKPVHLIEEIRVDREEVGSPLIVLAERSARRTRVEGVFRSTDSSVVFVVLVSFISGKDGFLVFFNMFRHPVPHVQAPVPDGGFGPL